MKVGYIRVSTAEQNLASQKDALGKAKVEKLFEEKRSGTDAKRPVLQRALEFVREGDEFIVTRVDRLARSIGDLYAILDKLSQKGVKVTFLEQPELNSGSPQAKLMLGILASVAAFETDLRRARQMEGIKAAKDRGVKFGREPKLTEKTVEDIRLMRSEGKSVADVMSATGLSKSSIMRACRESAA